MIGWGCIIIKHQCISNNHLILKVQMAMMGIVKIVCLEMSLMLLLVEKNEVWMDGIGSYINVYSDY